MNQWPQATPYSAPRDAFDREGHEHVHVCQFQLADLAHMAEKEILGFFYRGRDGTNDDLARHP